ncbi:restriction endonuclease [Mesorhizobium sp. B2-1-8]|uniref:restriction endonuclease n=1 Tax=Mesorhizobium sp. B2-1-8 TaxID=2589967 RepID=UPI001127D059|nr:restriction endonuclease [Mesorhizobium sp. B2-1-8]UCI19911.1 restriction endonuclease [Mesorhizobium sp. B2-1-8]
MTPKEYEHAVLERFRTLFPLPRFTVKHNVRLSGSKTKARRQVDVCVFEAGNPKPVLLIEAKRHKRPIDSVHAGATIALVRDVGEVPAVMVATAGFSRAARNYLAAESIGHLTITLTEAQGLRWIPLVEEACAVDHEFREVSGHLVEALRTGDADPFLDETGLPYEEWLAVFAAGLSRFRDTTARVLKELAHDHFDDGVRFNALQLLDDADQLTAAEVVTLLADERDPDTSDLLHGFLE